MMDDRDQEIFLEYIRKLLYDTDKAMLCRKNISSRVIELADEIEFLGNIIKDEKKYLTEIVQSDIENHFSISYKNLEVSKRNIESILKRLTESAQKVTVGNYRQRISNLAYFLNLFKELMEQLSLYHNKIEYMSNLDTLTGISNRRAFNQLIEQLNREEKDCAIVFIDIDGLKYCNDNYGHLEGNRYIKEVCQSLKMNLKDDEYIFRLGGDEFLILSKVDKASACKKRFYKVYLQFNEKMKEKVSYPCGFSFGCVDVVKDEYRRINDYLRIADKRMYHFKMKHALEQRKPKCNGFINKWGLDNRMFDVFTMLPENRYACVRNIETNVTRWTVHAVKEFDLPHEYLYDANKVWKEHIHPDDLKNYKKEIEAVFFGKKKSYNLRYRIRLKSNEYIQCNSKGYILKGRTEKEPTLFIEIITK